jgi:hypothetical protein
LFLWVVFLGGLLGTVLYIGTVSDYSGRLIEPGTRHLRQNEADRNGNTILDGISPLDAAWPKARLLSEIHNAAESLKQSISEAPPAGPSQLSRGVAIYFPASEAHQEKELKGLLLSVAIMRVSQPESIKTDLLVFTPPRGFEFAKSLGCVTEKRTSFSDPERCIIVEHVPLSERSGVVDPLLSYKRYLDSILMVAEYKDYSGYDMLIKTDMDTFVTPHFANWTLPAGKIIAVGRGGYSHSNADRRLSHIMKDSFGLIDSGAKNIGSTWYGYSRVVVEASKLSVAAMRWLDRMEFTEYERTHHTTDTWPIWYWPVLTMYGGHVSINQIDPAKVIYNGHDDVEMDYGSASNDPLKPAIKHIHCWHTDDFFSKFAFAKGTYDKMDLTSHSEMKTPSAYSAVVALSAVRLTTQEFATITNDPKRMANNEWKRLTNV